MSSTSNISLLLIMTGVAGLFTLLADRSAEASWRRFGWKTLKIFIAWRSCNYSEMIFFPTTSKWPIILWSSFSKGRSVLILIENFFSMFISLAWLTDLCFSQRFLFKFLYWLNSFRNIYSFSLVDPPTSFVVWKINNIKAHSLMLAFWSKKQR